MTDAMARQKALLERAMARSMRRMHAWLDLLEAEQERRVWAVRVWKRFKVWVLTRSTTTL